MGGHTQPWKSKTAASLKSAQPARIGFPRLRDALDEGDLGNAASFASLVLPVLGCAYLLGVGGFGVWGNGAVDAVGLGWLLILPARAVYCWAPRGAVLGLRAGRRYMKMEGDTIRRFGGYATRVCYSVNVRVMASCRIRGHKSLIDNELHHAERWPSGLWR